MNVWLIQFLLIPYKFMSKVNCSRLYWKHILNNTNSLSLDISVKCCSVDFDLINLTWLKYTNLRVRGLNVGVASEIWLPYSLYGFGLYRLIIDSGTNEMPLIWNLSQEQFEYKRNICLQRSRQLLVSDIRFWLRFRLKFRFKTKGKDKTHTMFIN